MAFFFSIIFFQSITLYVNADILSDGYLKITPSKEHYSVNLGKSVFLEWNLSVPNHEYAVYWEIKGKGVEKSGWGLDANCTTSAMDAYDAQWNYTCYGYYKKDRVRSTITVKGPEGGNHGIYSQNVDENGTIQWVENGNIVNILNVSHENPQIVGDSNGGAIVCWETLDIYAQKISSKGSLTWAENGISVCNEKNIQTSLQMISDGAGGVILCWQDNRTGTFDIYIQKIDTNGNVKWTDNGIKICTYNKSQISPQITADGSGGAIICWQDYRNENYDLYAQKINSSGITQWIENGTAICTYNRSQISPQIITDGSGGAIICWVDYRNETSDIYAQKINSSGIIQWDVNGTIICNLNSSQELPQIVDDGSGGAIICWQDNRNKNLDIYTQRINSSGDTQWTKNGTPVCIYEEDQKCFQIVRNDYSGAIFICWVDERSSDDDIYAQKINLNGALLWEINGSAVCIAGSNQKTPEMVSDRSGGAFISWIDERNADDDIFIQILNSTGASQLNAGGNIICQENGNQESLQIIGNGSHAVLTWVDHRYRIDETSDDETDDEDNGTEDDSGSNKITWPSFPLFPLISIIVASSLAILIKTQIDFKKKIREKDHKSKEGERK